MKINLRKIESFMSICWMSCWMARLMIIQIFLIYHIRSSGQSKQQQQQHNYDASSSAAAIGNNSTLLSYNDDSPNYGLAYSVLFHFGSIFRELGMGGLCFYANATAIVLYYPKCPYFYQKFRQICKQEVILFLTDPKKSKEINTNRLRDCLSLVIYSNLNYTRSILDIMMKKSINSPAILHKSESSYISSSSSRLCPTAEQLEQANSEIENYIKELGFTYNSSENEPLRRLVEGLRKQYDNLMDELNSGESSNCWPADRRQENRERMRKEFLYLVGLAHFNTWFYVVICYHFAVYLAYTAIINNHALPAEMRKFSHMEIFMLLDTHIILCLGAYWFVAWLSMLIIVFRNQLKVISELRSKFKQFNSMVNRINLIKHEQLILFAEADGSSQSCPSPTGWQQSRVANMQPDNCSLGRKARQQTFPSQPLASIAAGSTSNEFIMLSRYKTLAGIELDRLRGECDRIAMQIYISLRLFLAEIDGPIGLARLVMLRYLLLIGYTSTIMVLCLRDVNASELGFTIGVSLLTMVSCNAGFSVCAIFSANAIKLDRFIFSLIAQAVASQESSSPSDRFASNVENGHSQFRLTPFRGNQRSLMYRQHASIPCELMHIWADVNYLPDCAISPHTLKLWRRLVQDLSHLENRLFCTVAGLLKLEHRSILHFNFWFISVILVSVIWVTRSWAQLAQ